MPHNLKIAIVIPASFISICSTQSFDTPFVFLQLLEQQIQLLGCTYLVVKFHVTFVLFQISPLFLARCCKNFAKWRSDDLRRRLTRQQESFNSCISLFSSVFIVPDILCNFNGPIPWVVLHFGPGAGEVTTVIYKSGCGLDIDWIFRHGPKLVTVRTLIERVVSLGLE